MQKEYVFKEKSDLGHYSADAFTVRCVDDRFWKSFKHFIASLGYEHIDPKSPAGGAKIFASPEFESDRDFYVREIEKSIQLHHVKRVMLFSHTHCGAYGGIARFHNSEEKEFAFHREEHKKAKAFLKKKFPQLEIETYFIDGEGIIRTQ
ncbi:MAG: hypothetical protein Q8O83_03705 [bacterium]|nr:hypothetical protein [bacterium]